MGQFDQDNAVSSAIRPSRRSMLTGSAKLAGAAALAGAVPAAFGGRVVRAQDGTPVAEGTPVGSDVTTGSPNEQMAAVLAAFAAFESPAIYEVEPRVARELPSFFDAYAAVRAQQGEPTLEAVADVSVLLIPGPGGDIPCRVFTPEGEGPFPVLVYFHGGGWVIANIATYENSARALANAAGCVVVSVGYRQAPENPSPAAADDAYAALQYVIENANLVNGDSDRVAVGGESAGGNLATVACLLTRDQGGVLPVHQLLVYPVTTFTPDADPETAATLNVGSLFLDAAALEWFGSYYLPDVTSPFASPLVADLTGLPTATVVLAEIDPLRAQGEVYAQALTDAGVDTEVTIYEGVTHEFFGMVGAIDEAADAVAAAAERLTASFEDGGESTPTA
ncbi:MAG: alpha/beta hydrolase [Chloroflexota bacterium]|nr:alpha/beta hydrolase [Chloroflexota bacterium]